MKLTKYHKEAIVRSIFNDMPETGQDAEAVQAAMVKGMSKACRALFKTSPTALSRTDLRWAQGFRRPTTVFVGDADYELILEPWEAAHDAREKLKGTVTSAINGMSTRKQFIDTFPEFSAYAPPEEGKSSNLPAVANLVADLVKAGWNQKISKGSK